MNAVVDTIAVTAPIAIDWQSVEVAYRTTARSVREIAVAHGITHPAILKRAKRDGWTREQPSDAKEVTHLAGRQVAISSHEVATGGIALAEPVATGPVTAPPSQSAVASVIASHPPTKGNNTMSVVCQFRSPDPEKPVSLALTSGHTCVVGAEFAEIPSMFHRSAILAGCEFNGPLTGELQKAAMLLEAERADQASADETARANAARDPKWFQKMLQDDPRSATYRRPAPA